MIFKLLININIFLFKIDLIFLTIINNFILKISHLFFFYKRNELIWQEGLLVDFLQKKTFDLWTKKFLIFSSYLFNEKLIFDKIVKFFLNLIIYPFQKIFIFENLNISNFFFLNFVFFFLMFFLLILIFLIFLIF